MIFKRRIFFYSIVPLLLFCKSPSPTLADASERTLLGNVCELTGLLMQKCWSQASHSLAEGILPSLRTCLKRRSLLALDRIAKKDLIQITDGIEFVKYRSDNVTNRQFENSNLAGTDNWSNDVMKRIMGVFNTHILKMRMSVKNTTKIEARRRHHHMSIMLFGVLAMTMIAIPMGFQFLAVLGGKALLLAKLALILTSIQGLKKIATSNLGYGLYQAPQHSNPWNYDRHWHYDSKDDQQGYNTPDATLDLLHPLSPRIMTVPESNQ